MIVGKFAKLTKQENLQVDWITKHETNKVNSEQDLVESYEGKIDIGLCFFMHIIINNAPRLFFNAVLSVEKNEGKDFLNKVSSKVSDNRVVCALYFKTLSMSLNSNLN